MAIESAFPPSAIQKLICADLDDFYNTYDESGVPRGAPHAVKPLEADFLPPSTYEEAEFVKHLHEVVYEGTYPFLEILDVDWIFARFRDPHYFWGIFRVAAGYSDAGYSYWLLYANYR